MEAASLINILALSPQIAGTVNTYSISSATTVPRSLVEISSNIWSFKNLMQCSNTLMASSSLPLISLHFTPRLSSCSTNQQIFKTFQYVNFLAIIFKMHVTKLPLLKQVSLRQHIVSKYHLSSISHIKQYVGVIIELVVS